MGKLVTSSYWHIGLFDAVGAVLSKDSIGKDQPITFVHVIGVNATIAQQKKSR